MCQNLGKKFASFDVRYVLREIISYREDANRIDLTNGAINEFVPAEIVPCIIRIEFSLFQELDDRVTVSVSCRPIVNTNYRRSISKHRTLPTTNFLDNIAPEIRTFTYVLVLHVHTL